MRDEIVFVTKKEEDGDGGEREREGGNGARSTESKWKDCYWAQVGIKDSISCSALFDLYGTP